MMPLLIFLVAVCKKKYKVSSLEKHQADYAIIVTAYEQVHTLAPVVASLLQLKYPNFLIYVVADKCDISQIRFDDSRVILLKPETTLGSNTKSHFYAIERFKRAHDRLTIIDSDNLVAPDYLSALNKLFDAGFEAVQGVRSAKNLDSNEVKATVTL